MIGFAGDSHMAAVMRSAAHIKGLETSAKDFDKCDLVFIAQDVNSDADLAAFNALVENVFAAVPAPVPIVITSQVPVGTTGNLLPNRQIDTLFYQVDTIIMNQALERAVSPEQIIVGSLALNPLPESYMAYLCAFDAPIVRMSITEAELTKHAINVYMAAQLATTNALAAVAERFGANWDSIVPALRNDKRIGERAYLRPGVIGGHLPRDVFRLQKFMSNEMLGHPFLNMLASRCEGYESPESSVTLDGF